VYTCMGHVCMYIYVYVEIHTYVRVRVGACMHTGGADLTQARASLSLVIYM
jgi:hypothetical protein